MHGTLIAVGLTALLRGAAAGPDTAGVMASVHQFVDAFNKGDAKAVAAACSDQTSIVDEFPPHEWHGAGGCAKWMQDYDAAAKQEGITDGVVTLGTPRHIDITADRAYVVVPADYAYKQKAKPVKETGSLFTLVLQKSAPGWRIVGWAWTKN